MIHLQSGDLVRANHMVDNQDEIDYFPRSNVIKATTVTPEGTPTPLRAGRLGYVHICYTGEDSGDPYQEEEMCLVDFTDWGDTPEGDEIITATLPRSFLDLDTHFEIGDRVAAKKIVEHRWDKLEYDTASTTPDETPLALLREGSRGSVIYPDAFLDVNFSFPLREEDIPRLYGRETYAGDTLILLVTVPPTFVELVERFDYEHPENRQEDG